MSHDVHIDHHDEHEPGTCLERCACGFHWSPTYNLAPMFREAGMPLRDFDGRPTEEAGPKVRAALERLLAQPDAFRRLNPENGWGSYDGVLPYVREFADACARSPGCLVRVT